MDEENKDQKTETPIDQSKLNDGLCNLLSHLEEIAEEVHNAWWEEKRGQGFHPPEDCIDYSFGCDKFKNICDYCHADMYSYLGLPENIKEYDRATVRAVFSAIKKVT